MAASGFGVHGGVSGQENFLPGLLIVISGLRALVADWSCFMLSRGISGVRGRDLQREKDSVGRMGLGSLARDNRIS